MDNHFDKFPDFFLGWFGLHATSGTSQAPPPPPEQAQPK